MSSSGMLRSVALVRTDVSEELSASFIKVTKIGELGTTLAVTRHESICLVITRFHFVRLGGSSVNISNKMIKYSAPESGIV
jgi:hypothetical protein